MKPQMRTENQVNRIMAKPVFGHSDLQPLLAEPVLHVVSRVQEAQRVDVVVGLDDDQMDIHR